MGEVFLAALSREGGFEKRVAIKCILPHLSCEPAFVEMFEREARLAAALNHRNIVQIFDFGREEDRSWIAMEYVEGVDLQTVLELVRQRGERLPTGLALEIGLACCRGLDHAHRATNASGRSLGLVHGDISPHNVLLSFEGDIKLLDFGLAHCPGDEESEPEGVLKGKLAYMSPEQALGSPVDRRSDLYAAGLVLYELLTGERALAGEEEGAVLDAARSGALSRAPLDGIPESFMPVLRRALDPDPRQRYPDAETLRADLAELAMEVEEGKERLAELMSLLQPGEADDISPGALVTASPPPDARAETLVTRIQPIVPSQPRQAPSRARTAAILLLGCVAIAMVAIGLARLNDREPGAAATVEPADDVVEPLETVAAPEETAPVTDVSDHPEQATPQPAETHREPATETPTEPAIEPPPATEPAVGDIGTLTVIVSGGNAALVGVNAPGWIDRHAPFKREPLPAGSWTVTVANTDLGLHWQDTVDVPTGGGVEVLLKSGEQGWEPSIRNQPGRSP